jgi:hypothetical protein
MIEVKNEEANYRVTMRNIHVANIPEGDKGYIMFEKDLVTIQNVTLFAGYLSSWGAIRWGLRGLIMPRWYRLTRKRWIK